MPLPPVLAEPSEGVAPEAQRATATIAAAAMAMVASLGLAATAVVALGSLGMVHARVGQMVTNSVSARFLAVATRL